MLLSEEADPQDGIIGGGERHIVGAGSRPGVLYKADE